jgi:CYTH domain-containing protein
LTKKEKAPGGSPSVSIMTSLYLSEGDLAALGPLRGVAIEKRRYSVETETSRTSVDFFRGPFEGLILAEVEFLTEDACNQFAPPPGWTEVTGDPRYSCGQMAFQPIS